MSDVERIREICKKKGVAVSKMEVDLGFGNGYLNPKKIETITLSRAREIAQYLNVDIRDLISDKEKPAAPEDGELSVSDRAMLDFLHSLPKERLRGILLVLEAPTDVLAALDREELRE